MSTINPKPDSPNQITISEDKKQITINSPDTHKELNITTGQTVNIINATSVGPQGAVGPEGPIGGTGIDISIGVNQLTASGNISSSGKHFGKDFDFKLSSDDRTFKGNEGNGVVLQDPSGGWAMRYGFLANGGADLGGFGGFGGTGLTNFFIGGHYTKPVMTIQSGSTTAVGIGRYSNTTPPKTLTVTGDISASGELKVESHITASGNISASGTQHIFGANVGIGTTSPVHALQVEGVISASSDIYGTDLILEEANGVAIDIKSSTADSFIRFQDGGTPKFSLGFDNGDSTFAISTGSGLSNNQAITIKSDGKVGIGNSAPSQTLTVDGNISASGDLFLEADGNINFGTDNAQIKSSTSALDLIHSQTSFEGGIRIDTRGGVKFANVTDGNLDFATDTKMIISESSGKVGIGTLNPEAGHTTGAGLTIFNNGTIGSTNNFTNARISSSLLLKANDNQFLAFDNNEISQYGDDLHIGALGNGTTDGNVRVKAGVSSLSTRMFISSSGNIGIGTTSPFYNLDVQGGTNSDIRAKGTSIGRLRLQNNNRHYSISTQGTRLLIFDESGGAERVSLLSDGNVGIGNNSPSKTLTVDGAISASGDIFAGDDLFVNDDAIIGATQTKAIEGLTVVGHISSSGDIFATDVIIGAAGTTKGVNGLTVAGDISASGDIQLKNTKALKIENAAGTSTQVVKVDSGDDIYVGHPNFDNIFLQGSGGTIMALQGTGNVGIGTTSPTSLLHLSSSGDYSLTFDKAGQEVYKFTHGSSGLFLQNDGDNQIAFLQDHDIRIYNDSGNETVVFRNNGKVGIGTTSPTKALQVEGSISASGDIITTGDIVAQNYITRTSVSNITQSFSSGSTIFGDTPIDDIHQFTGSLRVTGSGNHYIQTGNVGIGTDSPGYQLEVKGTNEGVIAIRAGANSKNSILKFIEDSAVQRWQLISAEDDAGKFKISGSAAGESLTINSSGNVGLGTTSPDTLLHISGANNVNLLKLDAPKGDFVFKTNSTSGYTSNFLLDDTGLDIGHDSVHRALNLKTGNADRLTILGGGNVGIGTTSPTLGKLHISGSGTDSKYVSLLQTTGSITYQKFVNSSTGVAASDGFDIGMSGTTAYLINRENAAMEFYTNASARMKITGAGNVGIGTTSPSKALEVDGDISGSRLFLNSGTSDTVATFKSSDSTARIEITDDNTTNYIVSNTNSDSTLLSLGANNSTHAGNLNISSSGNIGIGTTTPAVPLEVKSTGNTQVRISTDGDAGDVPSLQLYRSDSALGQIHYEADGGANAGLHITDFRDDTNSHIVFNTRGDNERMRIESDGKVGIGTISPDMKLHISSSDANILHLQRSTSGNSNIKYTNTFGSMYAGITGISNATIWGVGTTQDIGASGVLIVSGSNVGIGTTSPTVPLEVHKGDTTQIISDRDGNGTNIQLRRSGTQRMTLATSNTSGEEAEIFSNGDLLFNTSAGGNVGIGTSSPPAKLTVSAGGADFVARFKSTDNKAYLQIQDDDTTAYISTENNALSLGGNTGVNAANLNILTASGYVGIGTTAPTKELQVTGDISASGDFYVQATKKIYFGTGANTYIQESGNDVLKFFAGGSEMLVLDDGNKSYFTNGNVGIGTTSPQAKLQVSSSGGLVNIDYNSSTGKGISISPSTTQGGTGGWARQFGFSSQSLSEHFGGFGGYGINSASLAYFFVGSAYNDNIMTFVSSSKRVGIGTTSPTKTLQVTGDISASGDIYLKNNNDIRFARADGTVTPTLLVDSDDNVTLGHGNLDDIILTTDNGEAVRIKGDGKVGIGTTAPTALLEVRGDSQPLAMFSGSSYTIEFDHTGQEKFDISHGSSGLFFRKSNVTLAGVTQDHDFAIFNTSGNRYVNFDGSQQKVRIGALSGTGAPSATLHLSGSGDTNLFVEGNITASGDISASGDLFVTGEVTLLDGNLRSDNHFDFLSLGGAAQHINIGKLGMSASYSHANTQVDAMNTTNAAMFGGDVSVGPHNNGKLGVGNLTPEYNVDILGDSPVLRIADNNNVNSLSASFIFMGENGSTEARGGGLHYDGRNNKLHIITTDNGTAIQHPSGSVKRMTILETNGRVGIGMESPGGQLGVTSVGIRAAEFTSDNDAPIMVESSDGTTGITFKDNSAEQQIYYRGNKDSFYIETPTKLGLGTNDPIETLDVRGSASFSGHITASGNISASGTATIQNLNVFGPASGQPLIYINDSDNGLGVTDGFLITKSGTNAFIYNRDSGHLEIGTNDIQQLHIEDSATTEGQLKIKDGGIDVTGHITASGNISASGTVFAAQFNDNGTNLNVPDYVFEPEYKLKTLNEVEQHISQSKHLPNIPSMDDIKAWSELSYSDRDMKLLEKIEELTLYIIHLQKQVDELKKE